MAAAVNYRRVRESALATLTNTTEAGESEAGAGAGESEAGAVTTLPALPQDEFSLALATVMRAEAMGRVERVSRVCREGGAELLWEEEERLRHLQATIAYYTLYIIKLKTPA